MVGSYTKDMYINQVKLYESLPGSFQAKNSTGASVQLCTMDQA